MPSFNFRNSYSVRNFDQVLAVFILDTDAKDFFNKVYNKFVDRRLKKFCITLTNDLTGEVINIVEKTI